MTDQRATYRHVLADSRFSSLLASKLATRVGRDALLYALIVRVVQETESTRHTTLLVLAYTIPSVAFGLVAGAAAERTALRPLLVAGHVSRAVVIALLLAFGSDVWGQYAILIAFTTIGLFVGPAEASALPRLVTPEYRSAAHSLLSLSGMVGTVLGAVTLGPVLLSVAGWNAVIGMSAALHLCAGVIVLGIRTASLPLEGAGRPAAPSTILLHGWRAIRASRDALLVFVYLMIAASLGKVIIALAPYYTRDVLNINPEKMGYIAAPSAAGAVVSLAVTAALTRSLGLRRAVDIGFFVLIIGLASVGAVVYASNFVLNHIDLHVGWVEERVGSSPLIVVTMVLAILVGFGGTMLGIAGATTLNQEVPASSQARAHATRVTVSDAASLVPLFAVASVADLMGVRAVLLMVAIAALIVALILRASLPRLPGFQFGQEGFPQGEDAPADQRR